MALYKMRRENLAIVMGWLQSTALRLATLGDAGDAPLLQQTVDQLIADAIRSHPKILAALAQPMPLVSMIDRRYHCLPPTTTATR